MQARRLRDAFLGHRRLKSLDDASDGAVAESIQHLVRTANKAKKEGRRERAYSDAKWKVIPSETGHRPETGHGF